MHRRAREASAGRVVKQVLERSGAEEESASRVVTRVLERSSTKEASAGSLTEEALAGPLTMQDLEVRVWIFPVERVSEGTWDQVLGVRWACPRLPRNDGH